MSVDKLSVWLRDWIMRTTGLPEEEISDTQSMQSFGLSSRDVVILSGELENLLDVPLDATIAYEYPTISALAQRLINGPRTDERPSSKSRTTAIIQEPATHDIAIVGLAGRYPGAENAQRMWDLFLEGRDGIGPLPVGRWSEYAADKHTTELIENIDMTGGYLDDIASFDAEFFGLSPLEAANVDPQQRIILELTWEALENAHIPPSSLKGSPVGVYMGSTNNDYGMLIAADPAEAHPYALTGTSSSIIPNRVSFAFDFRGPSISTDTACSSSLVAIHQAVRDLREGACDMAIAGGVNILAAPFASTAFGQLGVFSPTGKIHAFSDDADGLVRADGAGVVVLKRVADAIKDRDKIVAVIKGSAVNSDGHSNGLTAPNPDAQIDVLERAYADAGIDPREVDYIEAHGTGTILGDPIEATAIGTVLGSGRDPHNPTLLGSAKTNFGHTEAAAGAAGVIKVALAMEHDILPPSLNFSAPNRYVDFEREHLEVVEDPREWPEYSGRKLAGISGFGFGGTNAHIVVSSFEASDYQLSESPREPELLGAPALLPVSGLLPSRRRQAAASVRDYLQQHPKTDLIKFARSLAGRNHGRSRAVVSARTYDEAIKRLGVVADGKITQHVCAQDAPDTQGPVFIYSGFGSQHRKMAKDLMAIAPSFKARLAELDEVVRFESGWSILDIVADDSQTYDTETAQVAITAIQIALTDYLSALGARPRAVVGMSMGEIAAAYACGGLSANDAMLIACHRSRLMGEGEKSLSEEDYGAMAVVDYSAEEIAQLGAEHPEFAAIEPAVYAAPGMNTIGGPRDAVIKLVDLRQEEGKFARLLNVNAAGHTSAVDPILGELAAEISAINPRPLTIPLFSSVERGEVFEAGQIVHDADYFVRCTRQPVYFQAACEQAFAHGHRMLVEISPHPVSAIPLMNTAFNVNKPDAQLLFCLKRKEDPALTLSDLLAKLYAAGAPIDFRALYGDGPLIPAPGMPWKKQRYWTTARPASSAGGSLLGEMVCLPGNQYAYRVQADAVASPTMVIDAVISELAPQSVMTAASEKKTLPPSGELTVVAARTLGGLAITLYEVAGDSLTVLAEAFAAEQGETAHLDGPALAASSGESLPEMAHADLRWDPTSGETVEDRMRVIVSEAMGYDVEDLPKELPLIDLGLDSLMGMRIKNRIEYDFNIPELQVQALRDASVADAVALVEELVSGRERESAPVQVNPEPQGGDRGVGVAPRDASERLVFATWASVVGQAATGVTNALPTITSEQANQIAERLRERSGAKMSAADILAADNLETIANMVRDSFETDVEGNIRVLRARPEGSLKPAVFMFHPAGGSSVVYQPLMRRLPEDIPVYGVERLEGSLEERAAAYLDEIKRYSDGLPIILGGWSFGGAIAYEVAHQLEGSDIEIATIALLDTVQPAHPVPDNKEETKKRWQRYQAFAKKTYGLDFPVPFDLLESAGEDALLAMMAEFLSTTDASEHGLSAGVLEHQRASFVDNRILDKLDMTRWADVEVPVILFRAERMHEGAIELEPAYKDIAYDGGWSAIVNDLEIVQLQGDHLAVVDEPEIAKVGLALSQRIAHISQS
ncbi:polyketide synthase Pks13 [Corynebacterium sp. ES2715-CONJ3]|uniref:polyketide synthase Pks13 n=1 Tax=Corynebacterium sp. ES2715-CONJ3 TaxID=2974028 RepID=UPI00216816B9|nr:polyketide synthase Pks13 [Corynebacterium sp. ES2715-CONJ3]MCS4492054.1 polyketide synthase Pks13 [Corynebacterium sp. ES2715-CONJ3]